MSRTNLSDAAVAQRRVLTGGAIGKRRLGGLSRRATLAATALTVQLGPALLAWGGWRRFARSAARRRLAAVSLAAAGGAAANGLNLGSGRTDVRHQRTVAALIFGGIVIGRVLAPISDRRDFLVLRDERVRDVGVLLSGLGIALFEYSRFVLGRHYSFMAAIQHEHRLVTAGPYQVIRHPGYLGLLAWQCGYALTFRSRLGLLSVVPVAGAVMWRVADEEALLAREFGAEYEQFRARTARFIPYVH